MLASSSTVVVCGNRRRRTSSGAHASLVGSVTYRESLRPESSSARESPRVATARGRGAPSWRAPRRTPRASTRAATRRRPGARSRRAPRRRGGSCPGTRAASLRARRTSRRSIPASARGAARRTPWSTRCRTGSRRRSGGCVPRPRRPGACAARSATKRWRASRHRGSAPPGRVASWCGAGGLALVHRLAAVHGGAPLGHRRRRPRSDAPTASPPPDARPRSLGARSSAPCRRAARTTRRAARTRAALVARPHRARASAEGGRESPRAFPRTRRRLASWRCRERANTSNAKKCARHDHQQRARCRRERVLVGLSQCSILSSVAPRAGAASRAMVSHLWNVSNVAAEAARARAPPSRMRASAEDGADGTLRTARARDEGAHRAFQGRRRRRFRDCATALRSHSKSRHSQ